MEEWPGPRDDLAPDVIGTGGDSGLLDRWPRIRQLRIRRARIVAFPVLAAAAIAVAVLVLAGSHRVPASHGAPRAASRQPPRVTISSEMPGRVAPDGAFATGRADGQPWRLSVQDIAGSGARCQPAVTVNGADADPLFPGNPRPTPVGDPAFMTLGDSVPGVGFAFIQVPAAADWVWLEPKPIGGLMLGMTPVTVTACGQRFRLAGFAYPVAGTLRIHETTLASKSTPASRSSYTVPAELSDPRPTLADPQVAGVWQDPDGTHAQAASATLASGTAYGQRWSIRVGFGTAGDCFTLDTSYIDDSANAKPAQTSYCGPISTPQGPDTIMALALGEPASIGPGPPSSAGLGVGYAVSVGPGTARLTAQLSDGSVMPVTPVVVGGRKYAAFFIPGPRVLTWLNWVNAVGQEIAGVQDLPGNGYTQFQP
ncbi:MAG: hypothetical protein JO345_10085 [Streptosporangiaceae bacterium]|nr:hypothetical protein [Streptosporangiaceae bacterium]